MSYNQNIKVDNFEVYYLDNGKKHKVFESDTHNLLIRDYYGYNEYFNLDNLNMIINNLYLRINFNGTYEEMHLVLKQDFANNSFFQFKIKKVSVDDDVNNMPVSSTSNNIIFKELGKLDCDDSICTLEIDEDNHKIIYTYIKEAGHLNVTDSSSKNVIEWNYFMDSGMIIYDIYENGEEVERINIDVGNLSSKDKEYIQILNDNYINKHLQ